jgi:hypothetical protein
MFKPNPEDIHFAICRSYSLEHISYIYPTCLYINLTSEHEIIKVNSKKILQQYADDVQNIMNEIATGNVKALVQQDISFYSLIDYIGIGNIPNGAVILYNLGFKTYGNNNIDEDGECYSAF